MNEFSLEYLISDFSVFEKLNMIRRLSDVNNKVVNAEDIVFPKNPMLHMLDNFSHSDASTDTFDVEKYPFINNRQNIKYIHNFIDFEKIDTEYLDKFGHRLYRSKLQENIRAFNLTHRKVMIPALQLETVVSNKNTVIIENYNPLYRMLSTNARPINQYYRYQAILSTVLKNTTKYDRQHFLVIPVESNFTVSRTNVMAIAQSKEITSQRLLSSNHFYFFMIDLALILLDNLSKVSTLSCISPKQLSSLNVVFIHQGKCILFNIGKLATLITSKPYLFNFINNVSALSGIPEVQLEVVEDIPPDIPNETNDINIDNPKKIESPPTTQQPTTETFSEVSELQYPELSLYYANKRDLMNNLNMFRREKKSFVGYGIYRLSSVSRKMLVSSLVIVRDFPGNIFSVQDFAENDNIMILENVYTEEVYRQHGLMKKLIEFILGKYKEPIFIKVDKSNTTAIEFYQGIGFYYTNINPNDTDSIILGIRYRKTDRTIKTNEIKKSFTKEPTRSPLIPSIVKDDDKLKSITDKMNLTDKQRSRIDTLAERYKEIRITTDDGEKTIQEIVETPVDISVKSEPIGMTNTAGIDESYISSTTHVFDTNYREKLLHRDILNNVISFRENGLFLTNYVEKNEYNSFTRVKHVKATFTDVRNKNHTISFKLPMPDDEGYYLVNGVRLSMTKQLVNIPICKISPTRVSLISNYNKTLVDKVKSVRHSITENLAKKAEKLNIKLVPKINTYIGLTLPYEYKQFGRMYSKIVSNDYTFFFEYDIRYQFFDYREKEKLAWFVVESNLKSLEDQYGVIVGHLNTDNTTLIFMNKRNELTAVNVHSLNKTEIPKYLSECFGDFEVTAEWCDLKILDKNIPIAFILSYRYGLSKVLNNLKIDYRFVEKSTGERVKKKNSDIVIEFEDGWLVINRYPLLHSYIVSGLKNFATLSDYKMIDLDGKDAYYGLLSEKGMSMNYLKGIDNYFSFFVDPITKEVLQEMGEPTNTRDLLIRAVELLIYDNDKAPSAISNFRVRSAEKIPAMIYNEIARQYANYINSEFKDVSFSINTEAIFQRLIQDETMGLREDINPIHAIKEVSRVTHSGFGGRSSDAFVSRDRKYAKDAIGVISESTTDSGSVGMVASLSGDPKIKNLRGMFDTEKTELNIANVLSDTSLLMPGTVHDDQVN